MSRMPFVSPYTPNTSDNDHPTLPEKRLVASLLVRAVMDYKGIFTTTKHKTKRRADALSACQWIHSNATYSENYFTFLHVCEILDICPKKTREAIEGLTEAKAELLRWARLIVAREKQKAYSRGYLPKRRSKVSEYASQFWEHIVGSPLEDDDEPDPTTQT